MKKTIILKINADFGSAWQKTSGLDTLTALLKGWTMFYERNHKKTKIKYELIEESNNIKG